MGKGREGDDISPREFIEAVNASHWLAHERVHDAESRALALASAELARRLEALNHAYEDARQKELNFVPRETYDTSQRELTKRAEALATEVARRAEALVSSQQTYLPREIFDTYVKEQQVREERIAFDRSSFVSREFFDQYAKEQQTQHSRVLDQLSVTYTDISNMKGRSAAYTAAIGIFFTVVMIAVTILGRVFQ